jgi:Tripartite tricarboxylate transporter TctB family
MKIRVLSQKEFVAGILFMLVGLCWAYASSKYDLGTATDMGPGYFPMAVSIAITIMGACSVVRATRVVDLDKIGGWSPFVFVIILLSVVSFGLLLNYAGLVPASIALILISCCQRILKKPLEVLALAVLLIGFNVILFIYLLKLPLNLF